jgi:WW domain-binding protein 2
VIYLPKTSTTALQSFSSPILNLHDTHVAAPFFGPNTWTAALEVVAGGNIPPHNSSSGLELKFVFKDGGAFDFHTNFEKIKEKLSQALAVARESGNIPRGAGAGAGPLSGINLAAVHLEQLPAYGDVGMTSPVLANHSVPLSPLSPSSNQQEPPLPDDTLGTTGDGAGILPNSPPTQDATFTPPTEPPPGYEEVQRLSVTQELERRLGQST